jgi:hypothetical protein
VTIEIADVEIVASVELILDCAVDRYAAPRHFGVYRVDIVDIDVERPILVERRIARGTCFVQKNRTLSRLIMQNVGGSP